MATLKKVKKAQNGVTKDSSSYYNNLTKKYFDEAKQVRNAPYGGKPLKEQFEERSKKETGLMKKGFESQDNSLRQMRKGKPGYDANGFPIKKNKTGGKVTKAKAGKQMIKRADGSVSQRGLWDNIRAAKGSGKKPTKAMLAQEKKIKAKTK